MKSNNLHNRMKDFESKTNYKLDFQEHLVIRLDGKAFHTYTRKFNKPFDCRIEDAFKQTALYLAENVQSVQLAYSQSDEITLICKVEKSGQHWFDGKIQKIASVAASMATAKFNSLMFELFPDVNQFALFDARVFLIPEEDLIDVLVWRQSDAIRNSVSALARSQFSHKELHGKSTNDMKEMLSTVSPWQNLTTQQKQGFVVLKRPREKFVEYLQKTITRNAYVVEDAPNFRDFKTVEEVVANESI